MGMKIFGPYPPDSGLNENGNGGGNGHGGSSPVDEMLSFIVEEDGDTNHVLPGNAFVKWLLMRAGQLQTAFVGIPEDTELLMKKQERPADVATTMAPSVWLQNEKAIVANGIEGPTRIVIIYSIIPLEYE